MCYLANFIIIGPYILMGFATKQMRKKSIHVPLQQGGKSSWNGPTDPNIKVDFDWFQTDKVCQPYYNNRSIYINGIDIKNWGKIPFKSQFSKVASLPGIGPQILKNKIKSCCSPKSPNIFHCRVSCLSGPCAKS
jgi:hypothetical protein